MKSLTPVTLFVLIVMGSLYPQPGLAQGELDEDKALDELSMTWLEDQLVEIDTELEQLANYSLRSGVGSIGYRSIPHDSPEHLEWIQVDLGQDYPINEIVLVPTIWRDTKKGFQADAFPQEFRIWAGTSDDPTGKIIAEYGVAEEILPRLAPLLVPTTGVTASWVRVEATRLSLRAFDSAFVLQLAEILVFSGQENVALGQPILTLSNALDQSGAWDNRFLVDGFMPYLMDSALGNQSKAYISNMGKLPTLTLDLTTEESISRIHLHSVDQSDTVPQAYAGDLGIPRHLRIEGANRPDFSDAVLLLDYRQESINDTGPIIMRRIPPTECRFVRFTSIDPSNQSDDSRSRFRIGFAEIELFAGDRNVALGKKAEASSQPVGWNRPLGALTDGNNLYGKILSVRDWVEELARRHDLEVERPLVEAELNRRYTRQKTNLWLMSRLVGLLVVGIAFFILIERLLRMRQVTRIKERFAADLHDELGANLHALGLLSDLAKEAVDSKEELLELLDRTRSFTERSGMAARYCTNMLEAKGLCEDLVDEMRRTSSRILCDLEHEISFKGEEFLHDLRPRRRIDMFFFYKESLTNIIRHSGATKIFTEMTATRKTILLTITDNGHGIEASPEMRVPPSLKRRARLLRGHVTVEHPAGGGTRVILKIKRRRFRFRK